MLIAINHRTSSNSFYILQLLGVSSLVATVLLHVGLGPIGGNLHQGYSISEARTKSGQNVFIDSFIHSENLYSASQINIWRRS